MVIVKTKLICHYHGLIQGQVQFHYGENWQICLCGYACSFGFRKHCMIIFYVTDFLGTFYA